MTHTQRTGLFAIVTLVALALLATPALADDKKGKKRHRLKTGDKAILFNMDSVFNSSPTSFDNVGVGGRYALNPQLVIRAGLGLSQVTTANETNVGNTSNKTEDAETSYSLEAGAEFYLFQKGPVGIYAGGILQYGSNATDPDDPNAQEVTRTNLTVAGIAGANYFLLESLSLGAEYRLGYNVFTTESTATNNTTTNTVTRLGTGSVGFILGFWF